MYMLSAALVSGVRSIAGMLISADVGTDALGAVHQKCNCCLCERAQHATHCGYPCWLELRCVVHRGAARMRSAGRHARRAFSSPSGEEVRTAELAHRTEYCSLAAKQCGTQPCVPQNTKQHRAHLNTAYTVCSGSSLALALEAVCNPAANLTCQRCACSYSGNRARIDISEFGRVGGSPKSAPVLLSTDGNTLQT